MWRNSLIVYQHFKLNILHSASITSHNCPRLCLECGQFFQYLQYAPSELDKDARSCVPNVSGFTCSLWERPARDGEPCEWEELRIAQHTKGEGRNAALRAAKGMDFFRVHYGHKGDAAVKFKALSHTCQIVNERLLECVSSCSITNILDAFHWLPQLNNQLGLLPRSAYERLPHMPFISCSIGFHINFLSLSRSQMHNPCHISNNPSCSILIFTLFLLRFSSLSCTARISWAV